jgi:hypothetical protein
MLTVLFSFTGYPDNKTPRIFKAGEPIDGNELPKTFVDMIIAKGLVARKSKDKANENISV